MVPEVDPDHALMIEENYPNTMPIDPKRDRFPYCIVWSPLPVLSWFIPFIGHIGICREDGVILDFAGPNFVSVDNFTFGSPTRYFHVSREQCCCLSPYSAEHTGEYVHRTMANLEAMLTRGNLPYGRAFKNSNTNLTAFSLATATLL